MQKKKKTDRVARYQTISKEWGKSKFLASQPYGAREGRKLQLANSFKGNQNSGLAKTKKGVAQKSYVAPTDKRRDNLTFKLRVSLRRIKHR